jgi:hypothetical protein
LRDYGKVFCSLWSSTDFRSLEEDGRTLVLYLLTCPHVTIAGVFRLPDGYITEDLQWSRERVSKGFLDLQDRGFATRCPITQWVWIKKFLDWNPPENPNQWKAVKKVISQIPKDCEWIDSYKATFNNEPTEPPGNPSATLPEPGTVTVAVTEGRRAPAAPTPRNVSRGTRIPDYFTLTDERAAVALAEKLDPRRTFADFRDYWIAKAGKDAVKLDWEATWRVWCRKDFNKPKGQAAQDFAAAKREASERIEWANLEERAKRAGFRDRTPADDLLGYRTLVERHESNRPRVGTVQPIAELLARKA